ncbi:hypothetical protein ACI3PF_17465, partial [Lactococcus lactis]
LKKLLSAFNTRVGLLSFIVFFVWVKSMIAYFGVFNLRGVGPAELLLMIINPIGFTHTKNTIKLSKPTRVLKADSNFFNLLSPENILILP